MTDQDRCDDEKRSILVCEDDPVQARLLQELLEAKGFACVGPCVSPRQAEEAAQTAPVCAALLDVGLEGGSSRKAASILKDRGIPFAFITAYGPGTSATIANHSSELIVPKPVSPDLLMDILENLIPSLAA